MNILVTGAAGFVGKNLVAALKNLKAGTDRTRPELTIGEIYEYDVDTGAAGRILCGGGFCVQSGRGEPPEGQFGVHGREFWICRYASGTFKEAWKYMSGDAGVFNPGNSPGKVCRFRLWKV